MKAYLYCEKAKPFLNKTFCGTDDRNGFYWMLSEHRHGKSSVGIWEGEAGKDAVDLPAWALGGCFSYESGPLNGTICAVCDIEKVEYLDRMFMPEIQYWWYPRYTCMPADRLKEYFEKKGKGRECAGLYFTFLSNVRSIKPPKLTDIPLEKPRHPVEYGIEFGGWVQKVLTYPPKRMRPVARWNGRRKHYEDAVVIPVTPKQMRDILNGDQVAVATKYVTERLRWLSGEPRRFKE